MTNSARVFIDLIIVSSDESLVAEEVDGLVFNTRDVLFSLDVLQAVGLVPTSGEDIERDLTTNRVAVLADRLAPYQKSTSPDKDLRETVVGELLLQGLHQGLSDVVNLVKATAQVS